jgi:hypothetical protein
MKFEQADSAAEGTACHDACIDGRWCVLVLVVGRSSWSSLREYGGLYKRCQEQARSGGDNAIPLALLLAILI